MNNNPVPGARQPNVERISVLCTRPQHAGESAHPHVNHLMPEAILATPKDCKCVVCGMPLILGDRFVPIKRLGSGGFGITFLAKDLRFQRQGVTLKESIEKARHRAVKLFHPHRPLPANIVAKARRYFINEGQVLDDLKNERIPKFIDSLDIEVAPDKRFRNRGNSGSSNPRGRYLYLVQEYIDGRNLNSELKAKSSGARQFTEPEVKDLLQQLLPVLKAIHNRGILHRDISPQNIILSQGKYHLIDFGAVKQRVEDEVTLMSPSPQETVIGNPEYMSPEQSRSTSTQPLTAAADIFALGTTCVQLLTHLRPKSDLNIPADLVKWKKYAQVSPKFAEILTKMLAPRPEDRYQSAEAVLQALNPAQPESRSNGWMARLGLPGLLLGGLVLASLLGLGVWRFWPRSNPAATAQPSLVGEADFSRGENILREIPSSDPICQAAVADKQNGRQAFADAITLSDQTGPAYRASLRAAEDYFKSAVEKMAVSSDSNCRYDPETLIALGNVRALQVGNPVTLAVVVPLSGKGLRGSATEILSGVAIEQATNNGIEIKNRKVVFRNITARPLQIVIAQDADDPEKARQIAQALVNNAIPGDPNFQSEILGVVGHSSSLTTDPAGLIYGDPALGDRRLPLIAPTSTAVRRSATNSDSQFPRFSDYVFRMSPTDAFAARDLATYARSKNYRRVFLVFDSKDPYSRSLRSAFSKEFKGRGGVVNSNSECDLSVFTGNECLQKIPRSDDFILIVTSSRKLTDTSQVIRDNAKGRKIPILGGDTLYSGRLVGDAGEALSGTIVSVPWYAQLAEQQYKNLFKMFLRTEMVSWRVGMAHDAAMTLFEAIEQQSQPTRSGTFAQLKTMSSQGMTGPIQFCPSGDRKISTQGLGVIAEVQTQAEPPYRLIAEPARSSSQSCAE